MSDARVILTVDTNRKNQELLEAFLERNGFGARRATTLPEMDALLSAPELPQMALVDVSGFDSRIWERCRRLKELGVPHLVISPQERPLVEKEGLEHGARAVLLKPLVARRLMRLIETLLDEP